MIHWIWGLLLLIGGIFIGGWLISLHASKRINELKYWNRKLQNQRDSWKAEALTLKKKLEK